MIDFARLETAWRSSSNNPSAAATAYLSAELATTIRGRRRALDRTLAFSGVALTLWAGLIAFDVATGRANPTSLLQEPATLALLAVPVALWVVVARMRMRRGRYPNAEMSLGAGFRAALAENASARLHLKIIAAGQVLAAPLLYLSLNQLSANGKMAPHEQMSAAVILGSALAAGLVFVAVRYFTQVVPEGRQLRALVAQYDDEGGA